MKTRSRSKAWDLLSLRPRVRPPGRGRGRPRRRWTDGEILKRFTTRRAAGSYTNAGVLADELQLPYGRVKKALDADHRLLQHKGVKRRFRRRRTFALPHHQLAADLKDLSGLAPFNRGYKWILVGVDVGSRKMYARPLKDKRTHTATEAMRSVFDGMEAQGLRVPYGLQLDLGREFDSREMRALAAKRGVRLFFTHDPGTKASVAEAAIKTLCGMLYKYFAVENTLNWVDVLADMVASYNDTVHSATGMRPGSVRLSDAAALWEAQREPAPRARPKLAAGDRVYVTRIPSRFSKGYKNKYTGELFAVSEVRDTDPPTYLVEDAQGEVLKGAFYEPELAKVGAAREFHAVERVLRTTRTKDGGRKHLVRWKGYGPEFDQWVSDADLAGSAAAAV